jgi:hypothetical protein
MADAARFPNSSGELMNHIQACVSRTIMRWPPIQHQPDPWDGHT